MATAEFTTPPRASGASGHRSAPPRHPDRASPEHARFGDMVAEIEPLLGVVPVAGPPAAVLFGPWLLLGLMLAAPFTVLVTLALAMVAGTALVALVVAILASPFVLVRHLRRPRAAAVSRNTSAASPLRAELQRVAG